MNCYNKVMLYALLVANILMPAIFALRFSHLPPQIPLLYSRPWGEDQLIDVWFIFALPVLLNLFVYLNSIVYNRFFLPDQFMRRITNIVNWFLIVTITGIFIKIVLFIS